MDVEALRTFTAIHRSGGVTRAAAALRRSQPAVSRRLALLERELGVPLFERIPGGVVLSEAGRALLPFAEMVQAVMQDAEAAVRAVTSSDSGPVTLALVGTLASSGLTLALRRFAQRHPRVELRLRTATSREVSDLVRRAEATLGVRYFTDPDQGLRCEPLFSERLIVAAAPDHRLAGSPCGRLSELASERWIAFPDIPGRPEASAGQVRHTLRAAGVPDSQILRIDSLTAQKRLVEAGFGIAFMPDSSVREELAAGSLAVLDIGDLDVTMPVMIVTRRDGYLGAAARTLLDELRQAAGGPAPARTAVSPGQRTASRQRSAGPAPRQRLPGASLPRCR